MHVEHILPSSARYLPTAAFVGCKDSGQVVQAPTLAPSGLRHSRKKFWSFATSHTILAPNFHRALLSSTPTPLRAIDTPRTEPRSLRQNHAANKDNDMKGTLPLRRRRSTTETSRGVCSTSAAPAYCVSGNHGELLHNHDDGPSPGPGPPGE